MYHYTECGLRNVWLENGYVIQKTPYGKGVSIPDITGLHKAIGLRLAKLPRLTGAEFRFLRKELGLSQQAIADLLGSSEQNVSLWERRGRIPKTTDRLLRLIYLEHVNKNVTIRKLIERLNEQDDRAQDRLKFAKAERQWKEAT